MAKSEYGKNLHEKHRERMREKFLKSGFENMNSHEALEMLLFYCIPRRNTNDLAHDLINRFGSFPRVLEASVDELMKVEGIGEKSAILIKMILPLYNKYCCDLSTTKKLKRASDSGAFLTEYYGGLTKEMVTVICMDAKCGVLGFETVCDGDASAVNFNFRELMRIIMKYPLTSAVIIAHNHPLGLALPSREDIDSTIEVKKMLNSMGLSLVDHIIVAGDDHVSMAASGSFRKLFKNN